jgi:putative membrane protein insertion efficiency factor
MFKKITLSLIRIYQLTFSPGQGLFRKPFGTCRFLPTCSEYTYQAIEKYGIFEGSWQGLKRIFRCHPWHSGGYDPLR